MAISETNTSYSVSSYAITAHLDADSRGGSRDGWTRSRDKRLDSIQLVDDAGGRREGTCPARYCQQSITEP